jgi:hypothetical protein
VKKSVALLFIFVFLAASCLITDVPEFKAGVQPVIAQIDLGSTVGNWTRKASMKIARSYLGAAVVNGRIYAIGGLLGDGAVTGANEQYDPEKDKWTYKAPMPTPRGDFAIAVFQNKIYCLGGAGGVNEVYDPATDTWENKTAMPTPQSSMSANVVNGKIFVIGGDSNKTINQVYDPATDSWTTKAPIPSEVWGYSSAVFDNKIYVFLSYLNAVYDVENDKWSTEGSMPQPSTVGTAKACATVGVNASKRIYVLSASIWDTEDERTQSNQIYDPDYDRWMYGANFTTFRSHFAVAVVNDRIYAIGGFTIKGVSIAEYLKTFDWYKETYYATNEEYTPIDYGTPDPSYVPPDITPPEIAVASPENETYYATDVSLNFTVNEPVSSMRYVLDNESAVEFSGNITLRGLAYGVHNVTVYAVDIADNVGNSKTISFTTAKEPESFPVIPVATVSVAVVAVVGVGLLVYFKKRRR